MYKSLCSKHVYLYTMQIYQNPDDWPPGGFLTFIQERTPDVSNSSEKIHY